MTREEAINTVKNNWLDSRYTMLREALETLIPELRESEDETIRKEIIEYLKLVGKGDGDYAQPMINRWIVYLEKQKAKERLDRMAPIYNDKESFEYALEKAWKYYNESASRTMDSFEDDYIECVFSKGFREGFLYKENQKEQKPVEYLPEEKVYNIMTKLTELSFSKLIPMDSSEYLKIRGITRDVRSLLDYPVEQRLAEWSEEDEKMLNLCEDFMKEFHSIEASMVKDWLKCRFKFLRPRPHWKPSEEQIGALGEATYRLDGRYSAAINSLYNDLKKLM